MATRIECVGARFGALWLPPFTCRDGEFVCLHVPELGVQDGYMLSHVLVGQTQLEGLRVDGPALYVDRPVPQRGFLGFLRNPKIGSWLVRQPGVASNDALALLSRYDVQPELRIGQMGWNTRSLLALETAFYSPARLIVFATWGLADVSIREMYAVVEAKLRDRAILHVSLAGEVQRACYPGAKCIELALAANRTPASGAA
jgi:hypothetical protein